MGFTDSVTVTAAKQNIRTAIVLTSAECIEFTNEKQRKKEQEAIGMQVHANHSELLSCY